MWWSACRATCPWMQRQLHHRRSSVWVRLVGASLVGLPTLGALLSPEQVFREPMTEAGVIARSWDDCTWWYSKCPIGLKPHLNKAVLCFLALQSFLRGCTETSSLEFLEEAFVTKVMCLQIACSIFNFIEICCDKRKYCYFRVIPLWWCGTQIQVSVS